LTVAIYPASFDPIHYGHIDIATRAAASSIA
jgi:cytidyltransferase-like protein